MKEKGKAEAAASDPAQAGIGPGGPRPSWPPRRWAGLFSLLLCRPGRGGSPVGSLGRGARLQTGGGVLACRCLGDSQSDGFPGKSQPHPGVATGEELLPFKLPSFRGRAELGLCWPGEEINPGFPKPAFTEQFHSPRRYAPGLCFHCEDFKLSVTVGWALTSTPGGFLRTQVGPFCPWFQAQSQELGEDRGWGSRSHGFFLSF